MRSLVAFVVTFVACSPTSPGEDVTQTPDTVRIPLTQLGTGTYQGFEGGLYGGGANDPPDDHAQRGLEFARRIQPLDTEGRPDPDGSYVLLSIGMSNATQEFCGGPPVDCSAVSFVGQSLAHDAVERTHLVIVDGAQGGETIQSWIHPSAPTFHVVRNQRLAPFGLTESQVQVAWIKQANRRPANALPSPRADAYSVAAGLADILRALYIRYPNLQLVFLSSRIYGGYAEPGTLNPEPYAYESGFGVKWVIEEQIRQARGEPATPVMGDLRPGIAAPWIGWGPYLWANGETPRADGLVWRREDFIADATHPAPSARRKVGTLLLDFFRTSPLTSCWFLEGHSC
jgi:hypothetical protein